MTIHEIAESIALDTEDPMSRNWVKLAKAIEDAMLQLCVQATVIEQKRCAAIARQWFDTGVTPCEIDGYAIAEAIEASYDGPGD